MAEENFYPSVDTLISFEEFPVDLNIPNDFFSNLFYRNLQFQRSANGEKASYSIEILAGKIGIELGEDGFEFLINPNFSNTEESAIAIEIFYRWEILKYLNEFKISDFSFSPRGYFDVVSSFLKISKEDTLENAINIFTEPLPGISKVQTFVTNYNAFTGNPDLDATDSFEDLLLQIETKAIDITEVIFGFFLNGAAETNFFLGLQRLYEPILGRFSVENIKDILFPHFQASLGALTLGLAFPRTWLKPVDQNGNVLEGETKSMLTYTVGSFQYDSKLGFDFLEADEFNLTPSQIGNTGLLISVSGLKLDLQKDKNIPEAIADGRPENFRGIFASKALITLPPRWFNNVDNTTLRIAGYDLLIGTGGISGTLAIEAVNGTPVTDDDYLSVNIGNWELGFNAFDVTFAQNAVVSSNILARLTFPKFNNPSTNQPLQIGVVGHLYEEGDFNLTASVEGGVQANLFNFVNFNFLTLELGKQDEDFYIGTSCEIWFTNPVMTKLIGDQKIILPKVRIYSDGSFEIVGGNAFIPVNISLDLGPVDVAVTGIHFGSYEQNGRKYNYWGFDGAISIDPLGIDARGEGIKYYYTIDNDEHGGNGDSFIRIQTITVDLIIPGTASPAAAMAIIHGMISIPEPGESPEYIGEVSIKLPKAKIAGGAAMRLQPKAPAFIIDAYVDLPAPIPIGPVGIYGFRGLLGYRYVAEKEAVGLVSGVNTWYDYYKYPPRGVHVSKFSGPNRTKDYDFPFSIGVGAVLGTSFDSGTIISIRAMMILSLPTLFMIDGRASIISARLGLDDTKEPPFFAFVAWGDNSIEMGMGADFKLPQSTGKILSLQAQVESRFIFNNSSAWYVNIGTRDNPNTATVFKDLINLRALSYLMMAAQGIEAGARVDFELKKNFFGIKVEIYAFVEMGGRVSFERPQMGGYLHFGGGIKVNVWRVLFIGFDLNAYLSAEAVKPFLIFAKLEFHGKIRVLRFLKIRFNIRLQLKWELSSQVDTAPVRALPTADPANNIPNRTEELVKGIHMVTNDTYDLNYLGLNLSTVNHSVITEVLPVDTYVDIKSTKGLIGNAVSSKIGGYSSAPRNYTDLIPPQKTVAGGLVLRQVKHEYSVEEIEIKAWTGTAWVNYHPYEAIVAAADRSQVSNNKIGYWQQSANQYDTIRLLATTPFTYLDAGEPGWYIPEYYGITASTLFCQVQSKAMETVNVLNKDLGSLYHYNLWNAHYINGAYFNLAGGYQLEVPIIYDQVAVDTMRVTNVANAHNFAKSLSFTNFNNLIITLPEDSVQIELKLTSNSEGIRVKYYRAVNSPNFSQVQFELVSEVYKTQSQLGNAVVYNDPSNGVIRIVIEPITPVTQQINSLREQIEALYTDSYSSADGVVTVTLPSDLVLFSQLMDQLEQLVSTGCGTGNSDPCKDMDRKLCEIYQALVRLYCFKPIKSSKDLNMECYRAFIAAIKSYDVSYPGLIKMLEPYYTNYNNYLQNLIRLVEGGASQAAIIEAYNLLYKTAHLMMEIIYSKGNCGCAANAKDVICTTSFQELRYMTVENYTYNSLIPGTAAQMADQLAMQAAVENTVQPIWRPNTKYYIRFKLKDTVTSGGTVTTGTDNYFYGFKTSGAVGHFSEDAILMGRNALAGYIDYTRSYPNADGNLLQAKPVFWGHYECKISVFFTKPFTYHMLKNWPEYNGLQPWLGNLNIKIKDPVSGVLIPYPLPADYDEVTVPIPVNNGADGTAWAADENPLIPAGLSMLNNLIESADLPCQLQIGDPLVPASKAYTVKLTNLKPQKLYTALLYNAFDVNGNQVLSDAENKEIHNFVFQTSRYENFEKQVNSYLLTDGEQVKPAIFSLNTEILTLAELNNAFAIVSGTNVNVLPDLSAKYSHAFDRVLEGIFKFKPLESSTSTEFNVVRNGADGTAIAVLVRNPEPFNNPKIALAEIVETLVVLDTAGQTDNNFKVLFSKDYAQAIIMKSGLTISETTLSFKFGYKEWNGNNYALLSSVITENITINQ